MIRLLLPMVVLLAACDVPDFFPNRLGPPVARLDRERRATCFDHAAVARAVVDGRRRGQSLHEQRLLVLEDDRDAQVHRNIVESVYDVPRPFEPAGWVRLSEATVAAAEAHCINRPGRALRGRIIR